MARILGGGAFGELRGKLGSMVFARNKGGAYVRQYAIPVDPRTVAQLTARNNFGAASSNYHGLSDTIKTMWNNFASSVFNPKTGTAGVPSGFNAFVSLLNTINNVKPFTSYTLTASAPLVIEELGFFQSDTPPSFALEANFAITSGGPGFIPFSLQSMSDILYTPTLDSSTFTGTFFLAPGGLVGSGTNSAVIQDAKGNQFGFKVFMSNPVAQKAMFIQNPYLIELGTIPPVALTTPASLAEGLTVEYTSTLASGNYQSLPMENTFVQLSVFLVSRKGALLKIGSKIVKLT